MGGDHLILDQPTELPRDPQGDPITGGEISLTIDGDRRVWPINVLPREGAGVVLEVEADSETEKE